MTPQEHLAAAETELAVAKAISGPVNQAVAANHLLTGLCHAVIALAAELGVPHTAAVPGAGSGG